MEPEEEPRNARETPQRMAGHGSAGASPYRQGGGHGLAWAHGACSGKQDIPGLGRITDGICAQMRVLLSQRLGQLLQILVWREFVGLRQRLHGIGSQSAFSIFDSSELLLAYP